MDDLALKRLVTLRSHPKYFMKYAVWTKDGNNPEQPCRRFPYHIEYHRRIIDLWYDNRLFAIIKSRQMQITWSMLGLHLWYALTGPDREIYMRRQTYDDALKLLEDTKYIYDHIPESVWPKELLPEIYTKEGLIMFPEINSQIIAVSSGRDKMRGRTPSAVLLDEFAFQEDAALVYATIKPSIQGGGRISMISTPAPMFGSEEPMFRQIVMDRS
jgi:hypothetical protein